jgi:ABC-type uncharacterized transport system auxiliary subunit
MSTRRTLALAAGLAAALATLAGCGERAQELRVKQPDQAPYAADRKAAWDEQIKARNQHQNEYVRAPGRP